MKLNQRYWYAFAILFLLGSIALGSWAWSHFQGSLGPAVNNTGTHQGSSGNSSQSGAQNTGRVRSALDLSKGGHLIIPEVGINAPVEPVGVLKDGKLGVPTRNSWTGVGWYQGGPKPGEQGSAVIDGHLDRPGGSPAVFWRLRDLHIGDKIMVTDVQGRTLRFQVMKMHYYTPQDAPTDKIFGDNSGTYLNLITCAGTWVPKLQETSQRLVVYTKQV